MYRYLNRGDIGLFAYTDGKCVGQVWAAIGPLMLEYNGLYSIEILDNSFYIHDVYTAKNYRNHRISSILLSYLLKVIECQVGYVIIDKKNIASLKVHMRMGFKPYMDVKAWRFWKFISRSVKKVEDGK